jgi:hypothetical protein
MIMCDHAWLQARKAVQPIGAASSTGIPLRDHGDENIQLVHNLVVIYPAGENHGPAKEGSEKLHIQSIAMQAMDRG